MSWADDDFDPLAALGSGVPAPSWGSSETNDDDATTGGDEDSKGVPAWANEDEEDERLLAEARKREAEALLEAAANRPTEVKVGGKRAATKARKDKEATKGEREEAYKDAPVLTAADIRRAQEDADFQNAEDLFGGLAGAINTKNPKTEADFTELAKLIAHKLQVHRKSPHYALLLKEVIREASDGLSTADLKDIGTLFPAPVVAPVAAAPAPQAQTKAPAAAKAPQAKAAAAAPKAKAVPKKKASKVKVNIKLERNDDGLGTDLAAGTVHNEYEDEVDFM